MAYTKTTWANSPAITSPINADNLNKIEDGLFDQDARITVKEAEASGWTVLPATLTYASATTMNTSVDLTGVIGKGDKIKLTQTTDKYFYVTAITSNLLTVTGGVTYTVASATITSPYYSHQESPVGFPDWFNCAAPTYVVSTAYGLDNGSGGQPTHIASHFNIVGRIVNLKSKSVGLKVGTDKYIRLVLPATLPSVASEIASFSAIGTSFVGIQDVIGVVATQDISSAPTDIRIIFPANIADNANAECSFSISYKI